jgi:hypothetical protein
MVWAVALVIFAGGILWNNKSLAPLYDLPVVRQTMPAYFPKTLDVSAYSLLALALLLSVSARKESRVGLCLYSIVSGILLLRFLSLIVEINYSSLMLSDEISASNLNTVLPTLDQSFFETQKCKTKYLQVAADYRHLRCPKAHQTLVWEL